MSDGNTETDENRAHYDFRLCAEKDEEIKRLRRDRDSLMKRTGDLVAIQNKDRSAIGSLGAELNRLRSALEDALGLSGDRCVKDILRKALADESNRETK